MDLIAKADVLEVPVGVSAWSNANIAARSVTSTMKSAPLHKGAIVTPLLVKYCSLIGSLA